MYFIKCYLLSSYISSNCEKGLVFNVEVIKIVFWVENRWRIC